MKMHPKVLIIIFLLLNYTSYSQVEICIDKKINENSINNSVVKNKIWGNGKILKVRFLEGSPELQEKVMRYAKTWSNYGDIKFEVVKSGYSDIRIKFNLGKKVGNWSAIGTDALAISQNEPSMNLQLTLNSSERSFKRLVLHEFGHALGCIHEHQHPLVDIPWNKPIVYQFYKNTEGWSKGRVEKNIFKKYSIGQTQFSQFDPLSIMIYPIPNEHTIGNWSVNFNEDLSFLDKRWIKHVYSKKSEQYSIGENRYDYRTGDFNGDGKTDLIHFVNNNYANVWLSQENMQFKVEKFESWDGYAIGSNGYNYKTGDFNGDGKSDLIHFVNNNYVNVWISQGNGKFKVEKFRPWDGYAIGSNGYNYKTGDFNGDGKTDLIHFVNNNYVNVWISQGNEKFKVEKFEPWDGYAIGSNGYNYKTGDFNGDGKTDLIHFVNNNYVNVWISQGNEKFKVEKFRPWDGYAIGSNGYNYKTGDFNGDGKTDLIHFVNNNYVNVWISQGNEKFKVEKFEPWDGYAIGSNGYNYKIGDFNGDGKTELIHFVNNNYVNVWISQGNGKFKVEKFRPWDGYAIGSNGYNYKTGDFNGDGKTELIHFVNNSYVHTWLTEDGYNFTVGLYTPW